MAHPPGENPGSWIRCLMNSNLAGACRKRQMHSSQVKYARRNFKWNILKNMQKIILFCLYFVFLYFFCNICRYLINTFNTFKGLNMILTLIYLSKQNITNIRYINIIHLFIKLWWQWRKGLSDCWCINWNFLTGYLADIEYS